MKIFRDFIIVGILTFLCTHTFSVYSAERPQPVVNFHLGFENVEFFNEDFIDQSGIKTIKEREIDFPDGRYGRGIRMNYIPRVPDDDNMSGIDLDLITAVMFNTSHFSEMGFNEPFLWGAGRLHPRLGAVAFWVKGEQPFHGPLFEQSSIAFGRLERDLIGIIIDDDNCLSAYVRDARYVLHEVLTEEQLNPERWNHIVFNWDWANGLELWLNGNKIASSWGNDSWFETMYPGLFHLPSAGLIYDELYLFDRPLKSEDVRRLMNSNLPPGIETPFSKRTANDYDRIALCSGADYASHFFPVTPGSVLKMTEVFPVEACDEHIPGWYVIDGRNEMAWPHEYAFFTIIPGDADYHAEKVDIVTPDNAKVNYVTLTGNLTDVKLQAGSGNMSDVKDLFNVPSGDRFLYCSELSAPEGATFRIPFTTGYGTPPGFEGEVNLPLSGAKRIHEIGLYHAMTVDSKPDGIRLEISGNTKNLGGKYTFALKALTSRDERRTAVASPEKVRAPQERIAIGGFRRLHIFSEPFDSPTSVTEVTLSLPVRTEKAEEALYVRVHDPAVPSRLWNQFALNMKGFDGTFRMLELTIDFQDMVLTGGDRLWIDIGSAGRCDVQLGETANPAVLSVSTTAPYIAVDAYAEKEIIPAKAQYSKMYEYIPWKFTGRTVALEHPYMYGGPFDILLPALAVKRVKPDHFVAQFMELMSGPAYTNSGSPKDVSRVKLTTLTDSHGAPDWAVYMRDYNTFRHRIADWWAERQNPDGQIGGGWNDDTLFMSFHMADLPLDGNDNARAIIDTVHTGIEATGLFKDGYCRIHPIDRLHTGDFISERYNTVVNNLGQAYAAEREMESAWHSGHPDRTPLNYGEGNAFLSSVNVLNWYWGLDMPVEPYVSKPLDELAGNMRLFASCQNEYTFYRYTASNVHRDDFGPYGSRETYRYLLGGERGSRWDAHVKLAVMWPSGGGPDVARLILRADDTSLEAVCYSFHEVKRDLAMRLCRIGDGRYRVGLHYDREGAGDAGETLWETEKDLRRFDIVTLPIPPRTPVVIRVEQLKRYDRPKTMPDLAVDPRDAVLSGEKLTVPVHNIGNAPAKNVVVRLSDGENVIEDRTIESIDAPTDFVPKRAPVTFNRIPESGKIIIIVDPEDVIREILEENNEATVRE